MNNSNESDADQKDIHYNLDPGEEYELNIFLAELSDSISEDDLKKMKFIIKGRGGSGKATLEKIKDPLDFFEHLKQKRWISVDNICLLQALIWNLGRIDLYQRIVEFCRKFQNILYFYAPKETPENGYKYVKFHVEGNAGRENVEDIKSAVARLVCVPKEFVFVGGIEKSNSIIITLMIPNECEHVLLNLTAKEKTALIRVSVDHFTIDEKVFTLTGDTFKEEVDEEILAVRKLIANEAKMREELDVCHADLIESKKKIKELSEICDQNLAESGQSSDYLHMASMLYNTYLLEQMNKHTIPDTLRRQTSMRRLMHLTQKAKSLGYDSTLIEQILEMNSIIVRANVTEAYNMFIDKQRWELQHEKHKQLQYQYLNHRLCYQLGQTLEEAEGNVFSSNEILQQIAISALHNVPPTVIQNIQIEVETGLEVDRETFNEILHELAKKLSREEKDRLSKTVKMDRKEEEEYQKNPNRVLQIILLKTKKPGPLNADAFIRRCLESIKRTDLMVEHDAILKRILTEKRTKKSSPRTNVGKGQLRKTTELSKKPSMEAHDTDSVPDIGSRLKKLEEMMEKVVENTTPCYPSKMPFDGVQDKNLAQSYFAKKYQHVIDR